MTATTHKRRDRQVLTIADLTEGDVPGLETVRAPEASKQCLTMSWTGMPIP